MFRSPLYRTKGLARRLSEITRKEMLHGSHRIQHSWMSSRNSRMFSAMPVPDEEDPAAIPSNLRFDWKSSFAPRQKPLLVAVSTKITDSGGGSNPEESRDKLIASDEKDGESRTIEDLDDDLDDDGINTTQPCYVIPLPDRLKTDIRHGTDGSVSGSLWLEPSVFGADPIRIDLIKQAVDYIRNKIRGRRKAKTKTIGEVSGSGRKVRQQKGTGAARAGHSRPAHWRGGAKAHGPKNVTDYGKVKMNKKVKRLAMTSVLSQKLKEGNLIVVDSLQLESHKTGPWSLLLEREYGIGKNGSSALILDHYYEPDEAESDGDAFNASYHGVPINLWVASGNIHKIKVANQRFCNVYDVLKKEKLILTLSALEHIEARWKD